MSSIAHNIIQSMEINMFISGIVIDKRIIDEVPFFKGILFKSLNDPDTFHSYINKISDIWGLILNINFKRLVSLYNEEYTRNKLRQQQELLRLASAYDAENLNFDAMAITPSVDDLVGQFKRRAKLTDSRRGISKRRRK